MKPIKQVNKKQIIIASVMKPLDEPRMFEKMGVSLAQSGKYEVHIIGYPSSTEISDLNIQFHPLPKFKRLGIGRIGARLKVLQFIAKVNPKLLIVNTHELLGVAILIRIIFGAKIFYDIQENYWRNILYTNAFPTLIRPVVAFFVRLKEWVAAPFFTHFFLAEKCYANELGFIKNKFTVIENKCKVPDGFQRKPTQDFVELIFTGTIAESTGVFKAIDLAKKLHAVDSKIKLTIIGYCSQQKVLEQIRNEINQSPFVSLIGGNELVPHSFILKAIATANFGIIYYPQSPHTENKIPTKLYEYLACQLPILLQNHAPWVEMSNPFHAAIKVDFEQPEINLILQKIHSDSFYSTSTEGTTWQSEEKKLLHLVNHIF